MIFIEKSVEIRYNDKEVVMQRYFNDEKKNNEFVMNENDSYHINKVMRMQVGEKIEVVCDKKVYVSEIISLNKFVVAKIVEEQEEEHELPVKVTICQSLVNEQKMDLILQKSVELGVSEILPYKARNSVVKENNKSDKKIARWQRIVKEASEQSKRNIIPEVLDMVNLEELLTKEYDLKLLCSVNELTTNIKKVLRKHQNCGTLIIVIGPEGGFTKEEEEKLIANGYISVSLGNRVLRTETASLVALSYINYELMR